jgi:hypothetical protein
MTVCWHAVGKWMQKLTYMPPDTLQLMYAATLQLPAISVVQQHNTHKLYVQSLHQYS